jgi:hypothetical protein
MIGLNATKSRRPEVVILEDDVDSEEDCERQGHRECEGQEHDEWYVRASPCRPSCLKSPPVFTTHHLGPVMSRSKSLGGHPPVGHAHAVARS